MANYDDPRKPFGVRLEESVIEQIGRQAQAQHVSPAEYGRRLIRSALQTDLSGGIETLGLSTEVLERIQEEVHARNVAPTDYVRTLIYDALTKDPGVEIDELRRTVKALHEELGAFHTQLRYLTQAMRSAFEALLITSAKDAPRHTTAQIEALVETVFLKG